MTTEYKGMERYLSIPLYDYDWNGLACDIVFRVDTCIRRLAFRSVLLDCREESRIAEVSMF
jgi:hypothetical protein